MVREIAQRHALAAPGEIRVISVIVDDLREAMSSLVALADTTRGRLLNAADDELQVPVPSTTDIVRRTAVQTALTQAPDGTKHVTFTPVGTDRTDAVFTATPT